MLAEPEVIEQIVKAPPVWRNVVYLTNGARIAGLNEYPSEAAARTDHER